VRMHAHSYFRGLFMNRAIPKFIQMQGTGGFPSPALIFSNQDHGFPTNQPLNPVKLEALLFITATSTTTLENANVNVG